MSASTTPRVWPSAKDIMKTERGRCAVVFLKAAVAYYKSLGIAVLRVRCTDNGSCYRSRASRQRPAGAIKLKHIAYKTLYPAHQRARGRPSASSRHRYVNGPMPAPISTPNSEPESCPSSCTATTGIVLMPVSDDHASESTESA